MASGGKRDSLVDYSGEQPRDTRMRVVPYVESRVLRALLWAVATLEALAARRGVWVIEGPIREDTGRLPDVLPALAATRVDLGILSLPAAKVATAVVRAGVILAELKPKLETLLADLGADEDPA